jgi:adenylate cyclase
VFSWLRNLLRRGTRKQRRLRNHSLILLAVGLFFGLIFAFIQPFSSFDWQLKDSLFAASTPSPHIVIAAIDDATVDALKADYGRLGCWPRSLHAQAIDNLNAAGASVIGFDMLFAEPAAGDAEMEAAMLDAGNVVLAVVGTDLLSSRGGVVFDEFLAPIPSLANASAALGHANVLVDGDGVVRRLPITARDAEGETYSALSAAVVSVAVNESSLDIPVDGSGSMRINYVGPPGSFASISYKDVISGDFDPWLVKGKIVLIGVTATGEGDLLTVPVSGEQMYGVEVHANAVNTILTGKFLTASGSSITLLAILLPAVICSVLLPRLSLKKGSLLTIVLLGAFIGTVFICFDKGYIVDIIYTPIALVLLFISMVICRITAERADRREVTGLFGKYVSPQAAAAIIELAGRDELALGGERREVTVLFADVRGFTQLSERFKPEMVVDTLNTYFSAIIERISANEGMVSKFAGDNIMAVWNTPQSQPEHAFLAVKTAIESQKAIEELNRNPGELPPLEFGIGINTGEAIAGSVGSKGRAEYTVIGDAVNIASRICGAAPGGRIWIGRQTFEQVRERVIVGELEPQYFKGKEEAFTVYEVKSLA